MKISSAQLIICLISVTPLFSMLLWVFLVGEARPLLWEFGVFCFLVAAGFFSSGKLLLDKRSWYERLIFGVVTLFNAVVFIEIIRGSL